MVKYSEIEIGKIAEFINGFAFKPTDRKQEGKKIIRIQNLTNPNAEYNLTNRTVPDKYNVKNGDILVSWSATIDVFEWTGGEALLNQHIFKVNFNHDLIYKGFFIYALRSTINDLTKKAHGSTMKHVTKGDFEEHKIPLPILLDQIKIATLLKTIEDLIEKRKDSISFLDTLLENTFLEMFGNPVTNSKGWLKSNLSDLCYFENGDRSSNYPNKADFVNDGIIFLSSREIVDFRFQPSNSLFISEEKFNSLSRGHCKPGDVIMTLRGNGVGQCCIFESDYLNGFVNAQMIILRCNDQLNNRFFVELIRNKRMFQHLLKLSSGSAQPQMTAASLKSLQIIVPPINLQQKFSVFIEKTNLLRLKFDQNLIELQNLYNSLSQRFFKGELDLSNIDVNHLLPKIGNNADLQVIAKLDENKEYKKLSNEDLENLLNVRKVVNTPKEAFEFIEQQKQVTGLGDKIFIEHNTKFGPVFETITYSDVANWIRTIFKDNHFNTEMLLRLCEEEKGVYIHYFTSKEWKENPAIDKLLDMKSIVFSALEDPSKTGKEANPEQLQLEQVFYDGEKQNFDLKLREQDFDFIQHLTPKERSGIYFKLKV